tara:strand:+ start:268 stop:378 length:111 start_codon:yes stop_codon:yes gene_type:complete
VFEVTLNKKYRLKIKVIIRIIVSEEKPYIIITNILA